MISWKMTVGAICLASGWVVPIHAVDELRTVMVVNERSVDSLTIANHYASLRRLPDRCIVALPDVPDAMQCSFAQFKDQILTPLLVQLETRGVGKQVDAIAYSADFPTAIDLSAPLSAKPDLNKIFTRVGAINGLTFLYQLLDEEQLMFIAPRCNFYARPDSETLQQNPFFDKEDREQFDRIAEAKTSKEKEEVIVELRKLIDRHPQQWPLRYRLAQLQVAVGENTDAFQSITELQREHVAYRQLFDREPAFDAVKDSPLYRKLLSNMPDHYPQRVPPLAFARETAWGQNGIPLGPVRGSPITKRPGPSYFLSTVLAVTKGRGTTLAEAVDILSRAVAADGTGGPATFYYSNSSDVRSTTRSPMFQGAAAVLKDLGHLVVMDAERLPVKQSRLMGAMLGSANYNWPQAQNQLLPGSIAENLTSTSGVLHQGNDQTSMVELLRGGAAGTSGTVTEPYALQFKFPTPYLLPYYAAGTSLAEAFYLSVESPYQLLIMGDPLCRPYGSDQATKFKIAAAVVNEQAFNIRLTYEDGLQLASSRIRQLDVYLDGLQLFSAKPLEEIRVNQLKLAKGWHSLDVIATSQQGIGYPTRRSMEFLVGEADELPRLTLSARSDQANSVAIECDGAKQFAIQHLGRRVWESGDAQGTIELAAEQTGYGPVQLRPLALVDDMWVAGQCLTYTFPLPGAASALQPK